MDIISKINEIPLWNLTLYISVISIIGDYLIYRTLFKFKNPFKKLWFWISWVLSIPAVIVILFIINLYGIALVTSGVIDAPEIFDTGPDMQFLLPIQIPGFILWFGFGSLSLYTLFIFAKIIWRKTNLLRSKLFWGVWIIFAPIFYLVVMVGWIFIAAYSPTREFTSDEWRNNHEIRIELIDNLLNSEKLDGLTESETYELLGEPSSIRKGNSDFDKELVYYLGPERGLIRIDSEWLSIWIKDGLVDSYKIWRD